MIKDCLSSWALTHILSLTVDSVTSNIKAIEYLRKRLMSWNRLALNGDHLHVHCCIHITNLIVQERFKKNIDVISKIRVVVKYVRSPPSRMATFKKCVVHENIKNKALFT